MKILYIVPIIGCLVFVCYLISKFGMAKVEDPLPNKFAQYHSIDSLDSIQSGSIQMGLLIESKRKVEHFITSDHNTIVACLSEEGVISFLKINTEGYVSDSLNFIARPEDIVFLKGFIIDKHRNQYYRWSFNAVKAPINITVQNSSFDWDTERLTKQLKEIGSLSNAIYVDFNFDTAVTPKKDREGIQTTQATSNYAIVTYILGDECFQLYTTEDVRSYFSAATLQEMSSNNLFKPINKKKSEDEVVINMPNVTYQYFQRLKLEKVRFSGGGGNAAGFTKMLYPGYLFTDVIFKNDTLKLKEFMYLDEERHTSAVEIDGKNIGELSKNKVQPVEQFNGYRYYTNDNLKYALFSNNDHKLYLIR